MISNINADFYNLVREAAHKKWDPIGVSSYSEQIGEYDSYLPKLCELLKKGASEEQIFDFLWIAETEAMGLSGNKQATREFSKWLVTLNN